MSEVGTETEPAKEEAKEGAEAPPSLAGRLAGVGEETVKRLYDEFSKNERAREAVKGAKDQLGRVSRSALQQLGIAPLEELDELRGQVERLEARVRVLEGNGEGGPEVTSEAEVDAGTAKKK
jgi:hypothetical protein